MTDPQMSAPGLGALARVFLRIGLLGFGGPAGQIVLMHRLLVDEKRWIGERQYLHALNYCMLLPGPEAQQLATYIGWLLHGVRGGLIAGTLFVLPGALIVLGLAALYVTYAEESLAQGLLLGVKAAVLALVLDALLRIGRRVLNTLSMLMLAATAFFLIFFGDVPFPLIVLGAGLIGALRRGVPPTEKDALPPAPRAPRFRVPLLLLGLWLAPVAALPLMLGVDHVLSVLARYFAFLAVVSFGGAYAVLAYLAQAAVETYGWLTAQEMIDGLGLAETTPGPLILVTEFVGFLAAFRLAGDLPPYLAGVLGALVVLWVTFLPSFLWVFLGAPSVERLRHNRRLTGAFEAISAAVVGVILNLSVWFVLHVLFAEIAVHRFAGVRVLVPDLASLDPAALGLSILAIILHFTLRLGTLGTLGVCTALGALVARL